MKDFFFRWLRRSLVSALFKGAISTASLAVVASLIFCLVSVSSGIREQLGKELSAYGANIILLPKTTSLQFGLGSYKIGTLGTRATIKSSDLEILKTELFKDVENYAPGLVSNIHVNGIEAGVAGYPFDTLQKLNPLWHVTPRWPRLYDEAMMGKMLAARLKVDVDDYVVVSNGAEKIEVRIASLVETGSDEDKNIFLSLELLQKLTGQEGVVSLALVRARAGGLSVDATGALIADSIDGIEARTLRQVAGAEESLLNKVSRLLWFVTIVVSMATAFTVVGTISVLLLGRRREIGLCMALGAFPADMRRLFLSEAAFTGIIGGVFGCVIGAVVAETISRNVFGTTIGFNFPAILLGVFIPFIISVGASAWPVIKALQVSPCEALRDQ